MRELCDIGFAAVSSVAYFVGAIEITNTNKNTQYHECLMCDYELPIRPTLFMVRNIYKKYWRLAKVSWFMAIASRERQYIMA